MSEQADGNRSDQDPSARAEDLEQRYVDEHEQTGEPLEGLDPEKPDARQTTGDVEGVAQSSDAADDVGSMSRNDP